MDQSTGANRMDIAGKRAGVYALLMWVSYADIGHLPALTADALWYYLAAVVVLSFGIYVVSQYYDNKHS